MALVINHNLGAERTLNLLEKNQTALGKDLKAAASGAKINDASDGASEYSISRRLEIEERGLGQDIQNVKTGGDLLAVAEGGIREVVENLRDMKQLAINAANDTNTDADRATIEKEFSHRQETIKEIAATTNYNGKLLLAGDYYKGKTVEVINGHLENINIAVGFTEGAGTRQKGKIGAGNAYKYVVEKKSGSLVKKDSTPKPITDEKKGGDKGAPVTQFADSNYDGYTNVKLDFSNLPKGLSVHDMNYLPFTVLCGGCDQYIEFDFDDSIKTADSKFEITDQSTIPENIKLTVGTAGLKSITDIPKAIFEAVSLKSTKDGGNNKNNQNKAYVDFYSHEFSIEEKNGEYYFSKHYGVSLDIYNGSVNRGNPLPSKEYRPGNPLVIHDTTHASNAIHVFIDSMHPRAITGKVPKRDENWEIIPERDKVTGEILKDGDGNPIPKEYIDPDPTLEDAHVRTRREALEAIDILDMAMNYALDQITDIGAYRMRLEQDEDKITVQQESATGSKSTIQDADMAATMTNLTKHNVLTQAAQLMLAQSNQDASRVLSLLQ